MIRIITVEREYGPAGAAIAEKLASQLRWKLWDQSLAAEIARLAEIDQAFVERADERCDSPRSCRAFRPNARSLVQTG